MPSYDEPLYLLVLAAVGVAIGALTFVVGRRWKSSGRRVIWLVSTALLIAVIGFDGEDSVPWWITVGGVATITGAVVSVAAFLEARKTGLLAVLLASGIGGIVFTKVAGILSYLAWIVATSF